MRGWFEGPEEEVSLSPLPLPLSAPGCNCTRAIGFRLFDLRARGPHTEVVYFLRSGGGPPPPVEGLRNLWLTQLGAF